MNQVPILHDSCGQTRYYTPDDTGEAGRADLRLPVVDIPPASMCPTAVPISILGVLPLAFDKTSKSKSSNNLIIIFPFYYKILD